jgi:hypothetical protein
LDNVASLADIPHLPIGFFKTHRVQATDFKPSLIFESSGTTGSVNSRHYIKSPELYRQSFTKAFETVYGPSDEWVILGLLPSYLERNNSSLVYMVAELIRRSNRVESGFYLNEYERLFGLLQQLERRGQKSLLIGVTFALLDFAEYFSLQRTVSPLRFTTIMETGGMKGRRMEMVRPALHEQLCASFGTATIHSEYGMTELLSQAYSRGAGIFNPPPWMRVCLREEDDPFAIKLLPTGTNSTNGVINIIDLANIYSCSFIATDDAGKLYGDGSFEVLGRVDNSDIRGCSLMAV